MQNETEQDLQITSPVQHMQMIEPENLHVTYADLQRKEEVKQMWQAIRFMPKLFLFLLAVIFVLYTFKFYYEGL